MASLNWTSLIHWIPNFQTPKRCFNLEEIFARTIKIAPLSQTHEYGLQGPYSQLSWFINPISRIYGAYIYLQSIEIIDQLNNQGLAVAPCIIPDTACLRDWFGTQGTSLSRYEKKSSIWSNAQLCLIEVQLEKCLLVNPG